MIMEPFHHVYRPAKAGNPSYLLLLHGTGGDERDMLPLADQIAPGAGVISPRGQVIENGAPRFFRRFAEGVLDVEDWRNRSEALAAFVSAACAEYGIPARSITAVGYSNGANIAQGLLLLHPETVRGAILFRPMFVTEKVARIDLTGRRILLVAGQHDPIVEPGDAERIKDQLEQRGASVTMKIVRASHGLVQDDIIQARAWFGPSSAG